MSSDDELTISSAVRAEVECRCGVTLRLDEGTSAAGDGSSTGSSDPFFSGSRLPFARGDDGSCPCKCGRAIMPSDTAPIFGCRLYSHCCCDEDCEDAMGSLPSVLATAVAVVDGGACGSGGITITGEFLPLLAADSDRIPPSPIVGSISSSASLWPRSEPARCC